MFSQYPGTVQALCGLASHLPGPGTFQGYSIQFHRVVLKIYSSFMNTRLGLILLLVEL